MNAPTPLTSRFCFHAKAEVTSEFISHAALALVRAWM